MYTADLGYAFHYHQPTRFSASRYIGWLSRVAHAYFGSKKPDHKGFLADYDTPQKQIIGLLQWLDQSGGKEKVMKKQGYRSANVVPAFQLAALSRQFSGSI
jgi:hypothetical protein